MLHVLIWHTNAWNECGRLLKLKNPSGYSDNSILSGIACTRHLNGDGFKWQPHKVAMKGTLYSLVDSPGSGSNISATVQVVPTVWLMHRFNISASSLLSHDHRRWRSAAATFTE